MIKGPDPRLFNTKTLVNAANILSGNNPTKSMLFLFSAYCMIAAECNPDGKEQFAEMTKDNILTCPFFDEAKQMRNKNETDQNRT